jgi:hypothetical protein
VCNKIPVQIIKHIPKTVTKKVCVSTKPSGYGHGHVDDGYGRENPSDYSHNVYTIAMPPDNNNKNSTVTVLNNNSTTIVATVDSRAGFEEVEPEVYYDEVEEIDYLDEEELG